MTVMMKMDKIIVQARELGMGNGNRCLPRVSTDYDVDIDDILDEIGNDSFCPI